MVSQIRRSRRLGKIGAVPLLEITTFLEQIGLPVRFAEIAELTFLPGLAIGGGVLFIDETRLLYPGDLLHEAGHLAVLRPSERAAVHGPVKDDGGFEMAAIAWTWAAAKHLGLDPSVVFHDAGYRGGARAIRENFAAGHFFGVPLLEWAGLTTAAAYPAMSCWLRDELGIPHLRRYWSRPEDADWVAANTLLCGLGIGLREAFDYLLRMKPSFTKFEAWILEQNGGAIDADRIERLKVALSEAGIAGEPADPTAEPVLSGKDMAFWDDMAT